MSRAKKTRGRGTHHPKQRKRFCGLGPAEFRAGVDQGAADLQIYSILKDSGMTQVEIAKILGVKQPKVSLLLRNRSGNFSVGRLMEFLTALRQDVEITVRPTRREHGALSVVSA
jgi:predicted XRE-type DNA-binding protein